MSRFQSYIVCTSPRSGSTLLCRMLTETGVAGQPDSHFHEPSIGSWLRDYHLDANDYADETAALSAVFEAARAEGMGETNVFGLRLQRHSFGFFMQQLKVLYPARPDDAARLRDAFGQTMYIHLTRRDKLAQAISYVKAMQTGLWHKRSDGTELERLSPPQAPAYDGAAIEAKLTEFIAFDEAWEAWFAAEGLSPLHLTYEHLSTAPASAVGDVLQKLGLDQLVAEGLTPSVAKLSDATSLEWEARYVAEGRNIQSAMASGVSWIGANET